MTTPHDLARPLIQESLQALRRGDKRAARRYAERAAAFAPDEETPWLILAAVASPRASVDYLLQALKCNPSSQKAREAMRWAQQRLKDETRRKARRPVFFPLLEALARRSHLRLSLLVLAVVLLAWLAWPGAMTSVARGSDQLPEQENAEIVSGPGIVKPTYTPTPTPTPTQTPTPTPTPTSSPTPVPPPPAEKRIEVDISEQHLYAYEGDQLVFSFVASTGMGNSTRTGTFSVLNKIDNAYGSTWNIWMPNWMGIYWSGRLQNGIHALPILPGGSRLWSGYLGRPISYGCVVLGISEAQQLYNWAEVGTVVEIRR